MGHTLHTTTDVIKALGGPAAAAKITGRKYSAAWNWTKNTTFPSNTFLSMRAALEKRGYTAPPALWRMQQPGEQ